MDEIRKIAERELEEEDRRKKIDALKIKLRERRTFWQKLFPYKITIERR